MAVDLSDEFQEYWKDIRLLRPKREPEPLLWAGLLTPEGRELKAVAGYARVPVTETTEEMIFKVTVGSWTIASIGLFMSEKGDDFLMGGALSYAGQESQAEPFVIVEGKTLSIQANVVLFTQGARTITLSTFLQGGDELREPLFTKKIQGFPR